jgi:hypothetical protein
MESISLNTFKVKICWSVSNEPLEINSLHLVNGNSVAEIHGARIFGVHFGIYYKFDLLADKAYFPMVFTHGSGRFTAHNEKELDEWLEHRCLLCYFTENLDVKVEKLNGMDYKDIRKEEIKYPNRFPFDELYDWNKEAFFGYKYIEI